MRRLLGSLGSLLLSLGCHGKQRTIDRDAVEWEAVPLPLPEGAKRVWMNVMRGTGPDDIWLLADADIGRIQQRLAFHYDGREWREALLPGKARDSLYPIAKDDVWSVGRQGTLAHWDGRAWTVHQAPRFDWDLVDVFARPNDVWMAAAGPRVVHFDGERFEVLKPPELAGSSTHILWGTERDVLVPVNTVDPDKRIARFDGSRWSSEVVGPGGITMIAGSGPDDVWALGRQQVGYRWDGRAWTRHDTWPRSPLWSAAVAGPNEAWVVGDDGVVLRWDGAAWKLSESGSHEQLVSAFVPRGGGPAWIGGRQLYRHK